MDSVSPETPIRDIVDRCRVWESHADSDTRRFSKPGPDRTLPIYTVDTLSEEMDDRVAAAVTITQPEPDQLETLLRRLLSGPVVPPPPPEPVPSVLEQLLQRLLTDAQAPRPNPPSQAGHSDIESLIRNLLPGTSAPAAWAQQGPMRRNWNTVVCFSCGKAGHGATRCFVHVNETFPFMLPGWGAEKVGGNYVMISPGWGRSGARRERRLIRGTGWVSNGVLVIHSVYLSCVHLGVLRYNSLPSGMWLSLGRYCSPHHSHKV